MRLDKYLKISRLVKRRTVANDLASGGHAVLNGKVAKASTEVKPGDELQLRFGNRLLNVRIEKTPSKAPSVQDASTLYTLLSETPIQSML